MKTRFASLALLSVLVSCGPPPPEPPEGFIVAVAFESIDTAIVESIRIRFEPPDTTRFATVEDTTFEGGAITLSQDPDTSLVFEIAGDHVRDHLTPSPDGLSMFYELQVWSDDPVMRNAGPLVRGTAYRSGSQIGEGTVFLPSWPPPIEVEESCNGTTCRARLAIICSASAASMGLCFP
jgi:hypothetical protein